MPFKVGILEKIPLRKFPVKALRSKVNPYDQCARGSFYPLGTTSYTLAFYGVLSFNRFVSSIPLRIESPLLLL